MAKKFPIHPAIEKLTKGNNSAALRLLRGFIGHGPTEDVVRIYLDLSLDRYIDVPEQYVHHVNSPNSAEADHAPSEIWIDAKTPLTLDDLYRIVLQGGWISPISQILNPKPTVAVPFVEKVEMDRKDHPEASSSYRTVGPVDKGGFIGPIDRNHYEDPDIKKDKKHNGSVDRHEYKEDPVIKKDKKHNP